MGIWVIVAERGDLEAELNCMGFSIGQKQLFCLARAALHKSSLVLLNETTSGIEHVKADEKI